jgi:lipid II:glycine glycyltransferase (peptidoglycan interpeptide bridge formation enzyme)
MITLPMAEQYTAFLDGTPLASIICIGFGHTFTYVHGASSSAMRNTMAPYLLQWTAIQEAKKMGFHRYDFWGIAPLVEKTDDESVQCLNGRSWPSGHAWSGITRFKVGFGGEYREYPEAVEVVCNRMVYGLLNIVKKIRSNL